MSIIRTAFFLSLGVIAYHIGAEFVFDHLNAVALTDRLFGIWLLALVVALSRERNGKKSLSKPSA